MKIQSIYSDQIYFNGKFQEGLLEISDGKIKDFKPLEGLGSNDCQVFAKGQLVIPGLIDTHVHINEPGRTKWEGFFTATQAACSGGITTLIDMPLNCLPVTTTKEALDIKIAEVKDKLHCNLGFWGGVTPDSIEHLEELLKAGVFGVKSFLVHSGIDEFPEMKENDLRKSMPLLKKYNLPYLIHAELDDGSVDDQSIDQSYQSFLLSRPKSFENNAIDLMIKLCKEFKTKTHIVHLSSADLVDKINIEKKNGLPFSIETCPHYLLLNSEDIEDKATHFKCCPPIREKENKEKLWRAIEDNTIDFIVSDHSPCTVELKRFDTGSFLDAWGGISSLQFGLPLIFTEFKKRSLKIEKLIKLMSENTAKFIGLDHRKGFLKIGYDADITIINHEESFEIKKELIKFKNKITPYEGQKLFGKVSKTIINGELAFDQETNYIQNNSGKILLKTEI